MSKFVLKKYGFSTEYVLAAGGFTTDIKRAQVFSNTTEAQPTIDCARKFGMGLVLVAAPVVSFAVVYIRKGEGVNLLNGLSKGSVDANKGQVDPSKRRFATFGEAKQHGSRFNLRKAKADDKEGSAGHEGYFIVETFDPVNSVVNFASGLTNSL